MHECPANSLCIQLDFAACPVITLAILQAEAEAQGTLHREVKVKFGWVGLGSELVALRLLPGLPRVLRLMPGHPFLEAVRNPARLVLLFCNLLNPMGICQSQS